jgi:ribosomal protein L15E
MRHVDFYEKAHPRSYLINAWWRCGEETSGLVVLSSYEIEETAPYRKKTLAGLRKVHNPAD